MNTKRRLWGWPLLALLAAGCGYNTIQTYDEQVNSAFSQIKVQLQRRADLIPNLVTTVQAYAKQERDIFIAVADARSRLSGAIQSNDPQQMADANQALNAPLGRLLAIVENYPQLKSNENFRALQDELAGTENRIAVERRRYNETAMAYNVRVRRFPTNILSGLFGFERAQLFEAAPGSEQAPQVRFGK